MYIFGFIWNQNPLIFEGGTISIRWWVIYIFILLLFLLSYLIETSFSRDISENSTFNYNNVKGNWYYDWNSRSDKKLKSLKTSSSKKEEKKKKSPIWTLGIICGVLLARFIYCNTRLHDISAFFPPLFEECLKFNLELHWYSMCWLIGLLGAYLTVKWLYKNQNIPLTIFDPLFIYCFLGILIGARLGHCFFYEPDYFIFGGHITEMIIPIRTHADGTTEFTGFSGLASHGGTIGLMIALWLYCKNYYINIWCVLDNIAIATGFTACLIRIGNFMNSEIVGKITTLESTPWAIWFQRIDQTEIYRHPGQLYEAIAYIILFIISILLYRFFPKKVGTGFYFGVCLTYIFTFRFFIEYIKEVQESFEQGMLFDMGQILSIPFIIIGITCIIGNPWMKKLGAK